VKVNGVWRYVYRAVDQHGQVIDVLVATRRDAAAARRFFTRALRMLRVTPGRDPEELLNTGLFTTRQAIEDTSFLPTSRPSTTSQ
jgi:transposase-like protein